MKILLRVVNFFVPTIIFLLFLEILFRLVNLPPYPMNRLQNMYVENDFSNFALSKNYSGVMSNLEYFNRVYTNDMGFRDSGTGTFTPDPKRKKILFVGDSMTFGQGVNYQDTFSSLLRKNRNIQIINSGVPSYGTMNSLGLLKHVAADIKPDMVILGFYAGNDFYDNIRGFIKHVKDGYLVDDTSIDTSKIKNAGEVNYPVYTEKKYINVWDNIFVHISAVYRYFRYKALFLSSVREIYLKKGITSNKKCSIPYSTSPFIKGYTKENEYKKTMDLIVEMQRYVQKDLKANFILLNLPVREQINEQLFNYEKQMKCITSKNFDLNYPNTYLKEFTNAHHIMFIDTTRNLQESFNQKKNPFFAVDSHLNKHGHQIVADLLESRLNTVLRDTK